MIKAFGILIAICAGGTLANAQYLGTKGLNFVAPQVTDRTKIANPQPGEIVFDTSSGMNGLFWGKDSTSSNTVSAGWIQLGGAGGGVATVPTVQTFTAGSGTYTTPSGVLYIKVRMVGGGGGGSGSGSGGAPGSSGNAGGNSTFGTSLLTAYGGSPGIWASNGGAPGNGANMIVSPAYGTASPGQKGAGRMVTTSGSGDASYGGAGGSSTLFGGGAQGEIASQSNATPNSGGGGSGAGSNGGVGTDVGTGGGSGASVEAIIPTPAASYPFTVGVGGTGGNGGTGFPSGGDGADGYIEVTEYYQ